MNSTTDPTTLKAVIDEIQHLIKDRDTVSVEDILDMVGRRSFGPILLVAGLVTVAPLIGDIPGVPTIMAIIVFLVAIQILFQRDKLWFPDRILNRSVKKERLQSALEKLKKPASYIDWILKPRLKSITTGVMIYPAAIICLCISLAMPVMEFIPFSANFAGAALTAFGLSFIARDGLMALFGYFFTGSIVAFLFFSLT